MRRRVYEKIICKTQEISTMPCGGAVYFRPFLDDAKTIDKIAQHTGERKSVIAQKLIHLILSENPLKLGEDPVIKRLDWLITTAQQNRGASDTIQQRLDAVSERVESAESAIRELQERSTLSEALNAENFSMLIVTISSLNQILSKLLEFLSPNSLERKQSVDIASEVMASLIEHSAKEFERFLHHHGFVQERGDLYIKGKVERLRSRTKDSTGKRDKVRNGDQA